MEERKAENDVLSLLDIYKCHKLKYNIFILYKNKVKD